MLGFSRLRQKLLAVSSSIRFWPRRQDITGPQGEPYLTRWFLVETRWFKLYLHRFLASDPDDELHDHPWDFTSLILWGGYEERLTTEGPGVWRPCGSVIRHKAEDKHRVLITKAPVWTLVLIGRKRRDWGFWVKEPEPDFFDGKPRACVHPPGCQGCNWCGWRPYVWRHWIKFMDWKFGPGNWR